MKMKELETQPDKESSNSLAILELAFSHANMFLQSCNLVTFYEISFSDTPLLFIEILYCSLAFNAEIRTLT